MNGANLSLDSAPAELLRQIQERFRELGLLGQKITLLHQGQRYLAGCDFHAFTVYRVNANSQVPPGQPGWPVCLVTAETALDETSPPHLEDEFSSGLTLNDWLNLIEETVGE